MDRVVINVKWKKFYDYENYFISNNGLIRIGKNLQRIRVNNKNGYLFIIAYRKIGSRQNGLHYNIHNSVWDHFGTGKIKGYDIHHKDFNFLNNHIDNLEYLPKHKHYEKHGCKPNKTLPKQ